MAMLKWLSATLAVRNSRCTFSGSSQALAK